MTFNQRIDEQAAEWAVLRHPGPLCAEDQRTFEAWLAADPRHAGAYLRAEVMWLDLDRVAALAAGRLVAERVPAQVSDTMENKQSSFLSSRRLSLAAGLAALATALGAVTWYVQGQSPDVYVSDVGEVRRVRLKDGSNMVLNTATRATVRIDDSRRDIRLDEGEGVFEVAKEPGCGSS